MWDFEGVFEAEQEVGVCRIAELYGGRGGWESMTA